MKKIFAILLIILGFTASCSNIYESKYYKGNVSDHFDGKVFFNPKEWGKDDRRGFFSYFMAKIKNYNQIWPKDIKNIKQAVPFSKIDNNEIHLTFVGHDTFLIQLQGLNILTDPIWSERASPFSFIGPQRAVEPGIDFKDLPKIDFVLISHSHYDHLDIPTVKKLIEQSNPKFFVGLGLCYYLENIEKLQIDCQELDWNSKAVFKDVEIYFLPAKHWSKRALFGSNTTLWGSFAIKSKLGNIYFAGDTAYSDHFKEIGNKFGKFKIALLPIGSYKPTSFMSHSHASPEESVKAHIDLNSKKSIGMHFGTFKLGMENYSDPEQDLEIAKKEKGVKKIDFMAMQIGEQLIVR